MNLLDQFIETANRVKPEWRAVKYLTTGGLNGMASANDSEWNPVFFDLSDDRTSAEFCYVLKKDLESVGYFKFTSYRAAPGLPAELYARGPKSIPDLAGMGSTDTEAWVSVWVQTNKEAGS